MPVRSLLLVASHPCMFWFCGTPLRAAFTLSHLYQSSLHLLDPWRFSFGEIFSGAACSILSTFLPFSCWISSSEIFRDRRNWVQKVRGKHFTRVWKAPLLASHCKLKDAWSAACLLCLCSLYGFASASLDVTGLTQCVSPQPITTVHTGKHDMAPQQPKASSV